jgi:hypothetical protein
MRKTTMITLTSAYNIFSLGRLVCSHTAHALECIDNAMPCHTVTRQTCYISYVNIAKN